MTLKKPIFVLDDDDHPQREALRYVRAHLDRRLERLWKKPPLDRDESWQGEARADLTTRYGGSFAECIPLDTIDLRAAVELAARESTYAREETVAGTVVQVPPQLDAAKKWLQSYLLSRWPAHKIGAAFIASDIETLVVANQAIDYAPLRSHRLADDPFPAPPILILGPTGTGKELLAKAIHFTSSSEAVIEGFGALNCGGLPSELLESELFGHKKGAFTGAVQDKPGFVEKFETLFLDEIGDAPSAVQVRLLRFLNSGEVRKVGANAVTSHFPRVIAATHREVSCEPGFRVDLYHRLRGRTLRLKSLRERSDTVPDLFLQFLRDEAGARTRGGSPHSFELTQEAIVALVVHPWPGNMREMKYLVESVLEQGQSLVTLDLLGPEVRDSYRREVPESFRVVLSIVSPPVAPSATEDYAPVSQARTRAQAELLLRRRYEEYIKNTSHEHGRYQRIANLIEEVGRALGC